MKRFFKIFAITLAIVLGVGIGSTLCIGFIKQFLDNRTEKTTVVSVPITREELLDLTNKERAEAGKNPLSLDQVLNDTAQEKCEEIVRTGTADHDEFQDLVNRIGRHMGENLIEGHGSAQQMVDTWMGSPDHKANILRDGWERTGLAVCESDKLGTVAVQHFSD